MSDIKKQIEGRWRNPLIAAARKMALDLLKPTQAQIEHGFEVHEQATVVEPYGFSAMSVPRMDVLEQAIADGADFQEVSRLRLRDQMTRMADDPEQRALFEEAWEASGVTCVLRNSGEEGNDPLRMLDRLSSVTYVIDRMPDFLMRVTSADHIREAKRTGKRGFGFQTNGVPLPQSGGSVESELSLIGPFHDLGVRMMHLTYNRRNVIGEGCGEPHDGGLSHFGQAVVAEMNRVGVIADLAHCSPQTCLDTARCSTKPVMISHATCRALNDHPRSKPDDAIKAVADTGGLIGICCNPNFLGRSGDIIAFLDHIDHAVKLVGSDHVAIAPDQASVPPGYDAPLSNMPAHRRGFEHFYPGFGENAYFTTEQMHHLVKSMAWTNWPLYTVGLVQRGYTDEQITRILGENAIRVFATAG